MRIAETAAFHELDVDAVEDAHGAADIVDALDGLVAEEGQGAALLEPHLVLDAADGHGLFDHDDAVVAEPVDHVEGLVAVGPALVRVDGEGEVGDGADGLDHLLVRVQPHLDFQDIELAGALEGLLAHDLGRVDADGEGRGRGLRGVVAPDAVPGGAEHSADEVMQGDVHGGLRRGVARGEAFQVFFNVVQAERIGKLVEVHLLQIGGHGIDALAQVGRHGGLAVAGEALIVDFYLHAGRGGAAIGGDGESVLELQLVRIETKLHPARAGDDGLGGRQGVGTGFHDRAFLRPPAVASCHESGAHRAHGGQSRHLQEFTSILCHYSL